MPRVKATKRLNRENPVAKLGPGYRGKERSGLVHKKKPHRTQRGGGGIVPSSKKCFIRLDAGKTVLKGEGGGGKKPRQPEGVGGGNAGNNVRARRNWWVQNHSVGGNKKLWENPSPRRVNSNTLKKKGPTG